MSRYGVPYKGNKSTIADEIIRLLPEGGCLVDLFGGGCAITHRALFSKKWQRQIVSDLDWRPIRLFNDAIHGKYRGEDRWISREDFNALKETDPYVAFCWSFGYSGTNYIYGSGVEEWKHAYHNAVFYRDYSLMERYIPGFECSGDTYVARYRSARKVIEASGISGDDVTDRPGQLQHVPELEHLQRLQSLERLESLERLDYREVPIPTDAIVYCDIPYDKTSGYACGEFDQASFLDWACAQDVPVFISSYQIQDPRFYCVKEIPKTCSMSATTTTIVTERVYAPLGTRPHESVFETQLAMF